MTRTKFNKNQHKIKTTPLTNGGELVENVHGTHWYLNHRLHREDGPAIIYSNGDKFWLVNGKYHREDGPAVELASGQKEWWLNNKLHREDGPAAEFISGNKEWWVNGEQIPCTTQEQFEQFILMFRAPSVYQSMTAEQRKIVFSSDEGEVCGKPKPKRQ